MQRALIFLITFLFSCGQATNNANFVINDTLKKNDSLYSAKDVSYKDTTIKVLWREDRYDTTIKDTESTIVLNNNYFKNISDPEKAAIGYVATFIGSECNWDGKADSNFNNLSCKVIKALGLGYQCSDTHLGFIRHWFKDNSQILTELKDCPVTPFTASIQNTFDDLTISLKKDTIKIHYEASGANVRQEKVWNWEEDIFFRVLKDGLELLSRKKKAT